MELKEKIKSIADRAVNQASQINTEEATKNALIMPFLQCLGYDVFNPEDVMPEYTADIGQKKGEKVDYAIIKDGVTSMLIECKKFNEKLDIHTDQLVRYFNIVEEADFGILTNGIVYQFFSDLEKPNLMDKEPFLEFNITDIKDSQITELRQFYKNDFNSEKIRSTASRLKFENKLMSVFSEQLRNPSDDFVKSLAVKVYSGKISSKLLGEFSEMTKKVIGQYLTELITKKELPLLDDDKDVRSKIVTTDEELEAFSIVKTLLRQKIGASRITYRDSQSYFAIFIDDNNRNKVCRLHFNNEKKFITTFDENDGEIKTEIQCLEDIFDHTDTMLKTIEKFV